MSDFDIILDNSHQNLRHIPNHILQLYNLKMLYLQDNCIDRLPEDFFLKLHQLTWLDLRNNRLTSIPETVAYHQHLENLLLSKNRLEALPNELGLLPKLKVLQIANNPIVYPNRKIIAQGTKAVCAYLKSEFDKANPEIVINNECLEDEAKAGAEEVVVVHKADGEVPVKKVSSSSLTIKPLSHQGDNKIVHKISKGVSKISLKSFYNSEKYIKVCTQTSDHNALLKATLKQDWLEKLRILLAEQERILQQEKNLRILSSWRAEKKAEPVRQVHGRETIEAPYDTDPNYNSFLSKEDLHNQIDKLLQNNQSAAKKQNVEKLISELVTQLKDMETAYRGMDSPRAEIEEAGKQIMLIMDIHKKLLRLQANNNTLLQ